MINDTQLLTDIQDLQYNLDNLTKRPLNNKMRYYLEEVLIWLTCLESELEKDINEGN